MSAVKKRNVAQIQTSYVQQHAEAEKNSSRKRKHLFRRLTVFIIFAAVVSFFMISTLISQSSTLAQKAEEKKGFSQKLAKLE